MQQLAGISVKDVDLTRIVPIRRCNAHISAIIPIDVRNADNVIAEHTALDGIGCFKSVQDFAGRTIKDIGSTGCCKGTYRFPKLPTTTSATLSPVMSGIPDV